MQTILTGEISPMLWLVLAVVLAVAEAATVQLVAVWFALGAVAAIVPALLGAPVWAQLLTFVAVAALSMLGTRPLVKKHLQVKRQPTNADRVLGETGIVLTNICNDTAQGRVSVLGLDWLARAQNSEEILAGEKVKILAIEGVTLIVASKAGSPVAQKEKMKL